MTDRMISAAVQHALDRADTADKLAQAAWLRGDRDTAQATAAVRDAHDTAAATIGALASSRAADRG
ncbi:hypothetical protein ACGFIW_01500 [Micromonospora sp. NPDC048935]|uniref:hypothetical protein n=1 Tax=Micromonospora sp. NPDC048935 TaxID=3364262 RepID=UPI00371986DD